MILTPVMKTCGGCSMTQPRDDIHYSPYEYKPGKINWKCRRCNQKSSNAATRKRRLDPVRGPELRRKQADYERNRLRNDPEAHRRNIEAHRRYYQRLRNDPERWSAFIVARRIERRARMLEAGHTPGKMKAPTEPYRGTSKEEAVPSEPLRLFLQQEFPGYTAGEIALEISYAVPERRISGVLTGEYDSITLTSLDNFFTKGMARPDLLDEVYPYDGL